MKKTEIVKPLVLMMTWMLVGCAAKKTVFQVPAGGGETAVVLKASSFAFHPAVIKARQGDILLFKVENLAGMKHNLTLRDPAGKILHDVDLPAGKTVVVEVSLTEEGIYTYDCDRPMHTTLGMSGHIEVTPRP